MNSFLFFLLFCHVSLIPLSSYMISTRIPSYNLFFRLNAVEYNENSKTERRVKQNKYADFSRNILSPHAEALIREEEEIRQKVESNTIYSTTVPTPRGSNNITTNSTSTNITVNSNDAIPNPIYRNIVPSDPFTFGYCEIGTIVNVHGVHGEVKVRFDTDFADTYVTPGRIIYIKRPNRRAPRPIKVISGRKQIDNTYIVHFDGITNRFIGNALKNYKVFIQANDYPALEDDEYLVRELIDAMCYQIPNHLTGKKNWTVEEYEQIPQLISPCGMITKILLPQDLYDHSSLVKVMHAMIEMKFLPESIEAEYCLIPFVDEIVPYIHPKKTFVILRPPKGLLKLKYLNEPKEVIKGCLPLRCSLSDEEREHLLSISHVVTLPYPRPPSSITAPSTSSSTDVDEEELDEEELLDDDYDDEEELDDDDDDDDDEEEEELDEEELDDKELDEEEYP